MLIQFVEKRFVVHAKTLEWSQMRFEVLKRQEPLILIESS